MGPEGGTPHPNQIVDFTPRQSAPESDPDKIVDTKGGKIWSLDAGDQLMSQINSGGVRVLEGDNGLEEVSYDTTISPDDYAERIHDHLGKPYTLAERKSGKPESDTRQIKDAIVIAQEGFKEGTDTRIDVLKVVRSQVGSNRNDDIFKRQCDYLLSLDSKEASELIATIMDWNYPKEPTQQDEYRRYQTIVGVLKATETEGFGDFRRYLERIDQAVVNREKRSTNGKIPDEVVTAAMRQPDKYKTENNEGHRRISLKDQEGIEGSIDPFHPKEGLNNKIEEKFGQESTHLNEQKGAVLDRLAQLRGTENATLSVEEQQALTNRLTADISNLDAGTRAKVDDWYRGRLSQQERFSQTIGYLRELLKDTPANGMKDSELYETYVAPLAQNALHQGRLSREHQLAQSFVESQPESVLQTIATGELYARESSNLMQDIANIQDRLGRGITIVEDADKVSFTIDMGSDPFDSLYRYKDIPLRDAMRRLTTYSAHNRYLFDTAHEQDGRTTVSVKKLIA